MQSVFPNDRNESALSGWFLVLYYTWGAIKTKRQRVVSDVHLFKEDPQVAKQNR